MNPKNNFIPWHAHVIMPTGLLLSMLFASCVTQNNLVYMSDSQTEPSQRDEPAYSDYQIQPNDALYIQISSLDDAASNVFAQSAVERTLEPYGAYMNSYSVDKDGYVQLPVIGKIQVLGKTTTQVSELILDSVVNILSIPTINVKLVNRYISVLGEVRNPGHFVYNQDKFTIYNALGMAGDITEYGNRKAIRITRNADGKNSSMILDLTKTDILSSPYYYLQPNDLIYVSPLKKRFWGMREFPFALIFSTITTALVLYTFIEAR